MLFMVIERFKPGKRDAIGERFKRCGRMLPEGVVYVASWLEEGSGELCFQLMEAARREDLDPWMAKWNDLGDFEVHPVLSSADYWARQAKRGAEASG
jgi:hypothetical protein